jgi:hypothetical protein
LGEWEDPLEGEELSTTEWIEFINGVPIEPADGREWGGIVMQTSPNNYSIENKIILDD